MSKLEMLHDEKKLAHAIRSLVQDERWDALLIMQQRRIEKIRAEGIGGEDAYQELKNIHLSQGRIAGLQEFFYDIEKGALDIP